MSTFVELKSALDGQLTALSEAVAATAKDKVHVEGDTVHIDEKAYAEIQGIKKNIGEIKNLMSTEGEIKDIKAWMEEPTAKKARFADTGVERKSLSDLVFDSPEFKDISEGHAPREGFRSLNADVNVPDLIRYKDLYTVSGGSVASPLPTGIGTVRQDLGLIDRPKLQSRIRDLFPSASTSSNLLEYFKITGLVENSGRGNAQTVPERQNNNTEFGLKPKSNIDFVPAQDPVRTIAHWTAAHRNTLADKPQLRSIIEGEMLYGLALQEDTQLLSGDGNGENILGLLNRPGIQHYSKAANGNASDWKSDSLRRAQTLVQLAFYPASGYILHPNDWEDIEVQRGSTNDHYAITTNIAVGAEQRVWRLPVVATPAIAEGTFLTGAFGTAAQIYDREQANVRIAEQHADLFVRNAVAILVEERLGLVVPRPAGIVSGTFA